VSIAPGEFFSLLGPSGSGKTTTLMMVAGFVHPDGGAILLDGQDIAAVPPQKRGFGMVFQNYAIFPHLNVFENIAFPLRARRWPKAMVAERVTWALEMVRLGRFADRYARQLSGGQQQRVALARAIVFHPSVVLMDEPLGALDKNLRYEMQVEIKEIQQRLGMTVLYVTHDQEEAMSMSDRIAIMNRGRIDQVGPPGVVYEQPVNPFVGRFLGEANLIEGTMTRRRLMATCDWSCRPARRCAHRAALASHGPGTAVHPAGAGRHRRRTHCGGRSAVQYASPAGFAAVRSLATSCATRWTSMGSRRSPSTCRMPLVSRRWPRHAGDAALAGRRQPDPAA
jgi:ABC-type Fe3+/spermidine/putrescine transport system ATPase subunit